MNWGVKLYYDPEGLLSQVPYSFPSQLFPLMALPDFPKFFCPLQPNTYLTEDLSKLVEVFLLFVDRNSTNIWHL